MKVMLEIDFKDANKEEALKSVKENLGTLLAEKLEKMEEADLKSEKSILKCRFWAVKWPPFFDTDCF